MGWRGHSLGIGVVSHRTLEVEDQVLLRAAYPPPHTPPRLAAQGVKNIKDSANSFGVIHTCRDRLGAG